ncbi:hypothetical protein LshimejAT787_0903000 [Lyophyllum shimeji]|uniref:Uncharacterized protein n=1 Tax=Lyophyllum shimeji TaxID=47721 RepID=A0A9P3PQZ5_LYOSH|nr:hypothetical protein LshimejAT787_0903000 [Lyophyllum shimeji]
MSSSLNILEHGIDCPNSSPKLIIDTSLRGLTTSSARPPTQIEREEMEGLYSATFDLGRWLHGLIPPAEFCTHVLSEGTLSLELPAGVLAIRHAILICAAWTPSLASSGHHSSSSPRVAPAVPRRLGCHNLVEQLGLIPGRKVALENWMFDSWKNIT